MATVCVCTYKRPAGLRALLDGVGKQTFDGFRQLKGQAPQLALVVVDNEGSAEVRSICEGFSLREWPLAYVHEPQRGISCLLDVSSGIGRVLGLPEARTGG